jgi:hypothetical protein
MVSNILKPSGLVRRILYFLLIIGPVFIASLLSTHNTSQAAAPNVAYWHFDEDSAPYIDSVNNLAATCSNCPTAATGLVSQGQSFNGTTNALNVAANPVLDWNADGIFTVGLWIKTGLGCNSGEQVFIGRGTVGEGHWALGCNDAGKVTFSLSDSSENDFNLTSNKVINTGRWHHVTAIYNGVSEEATLSVDYTDTLTATTSLAGGLAAATAELHIGHLNGAHHFAGVLDEVALYVTPLTASEVANHYYLARRYTESCGSSVRIMPLGDSITKGSSSGVSLESEMISYRKTLWNTLAAASYQVDFVGSLTNGQAYDGFDAHHEGWGGYTKAQVRDKVEDWLTANPADVVLLHIGTNAASTSIDEIDQLLNNIDAYNENITVVLARIINRINPNATTTTFNNNLATLAVNRIAQGDKIILVDMENGAGIVYAQQPTGDMYSNLHPYHTGYDKMAAVWFDALQVVLPTCSEVNPTILSQPGTTAYTGLSYTYTAQANGIPAPTFSLDSFPAGMSIAPDSGLIEWTPTSAGSVTVTVMASNSAGSSSQTFIINVEESAEPVFTSTPALTATVGELYVYDAQTNGNPPPIYSLTNSPTGMSIDPDNGVISWTPAQPGENGVTVAATNDLNAVTQSFNITVSESSNSGSACQLSDAIAYWKLDETSGTNFADYIGTNDGSCAALNCPTPVAGQVDGAQAFDGTNRRVNVPASTDFDWAADDSFSIALWVNIPDTATCSGNRVFIGRYGPGPIAWWVGCDNSTNRATFSLRDNNNVSHSVTASDTPLNNGAWHHIVAVREGGSTNQTRIYVNGSSKGAANLIFTGGFASSNGLNIGYYNVSPFYYLNGRLDEIAIYDRALSLAEIERHYQAGLINLGYEYDNWTTADGSWDSDASWFGDTPGSDESVAILNNTNLTRPETAACVDVMADATLDFASHELTVNGAFSNWGTIKQNKQVDTVSTMVEFLHVTGTAGTLYRGVEITPTASSLGNVEVAIRAADLAGGNYCTTDPDSPPYADRCFTLTPQFNGAAVVRLYAANPDELNSIPVEDLRPYRLVSSSWESLMSNRSTGTLGDFAYAQADTTGFSSFLLGGPNDPTAVYLQAITASAAPLAGGIILMVGTILLTIVTLYALRRRAAQ